MRLPSLQMMYRTPNKTPSLFSLVREAGKGGKQPTPSIRRYGDRAKNPRNHSSRLKPAKRRPVPDGIESRCQPAAK